VGQLHPTNRHQHRISVLSSLVGRSSALWGEPFQASDMLTRRRRSASRLTIRFSTSPASLSTAVHTFRAFGCHPPRALALAPLRHLNPTDGPASGQGSSALRPCIGHGEASCSAVMCYASAGSVDKQHPNARGYQWPIWNRNHLSTSTL
jgi:hypothetical protein